MDNSVRLQYLQAMGIDVWLPKSANLASAGNHSDIAETNHFAKCSSELSFDYSLLNWEELGHVAIDNLHCERGKDCKKYLLGKGNRQADWFLIVDAQDGDASLEQETEHLLTEILSAIGLSREQVFITFVLECEPLKADSSTQQIPPSCTLFLKRQIELVQPKMILALGDVAARSLLQTNASVAELRGLEHKFADITTVVTYHPAHLLDSAQDKRLVWLDLQLAMTTYTRKGHQ